VDMGTEEVFFDTPIMPYGGHNSGQIRFGADGYLYVSVGDGGGGISTTNDDGVLYPQALDMLLGKILRLTADGDVPDSNPYMTEKSERCNKDGWTSKPSIKCQEIYAYGLRNPFRFAMDPNERKQTKFYINDVGRHTWESIRPAGDGFEGANYGYPDREG
jgi:glucose/arabinose dehydrogenase